jgi:hypothetical protein
MNQKSCAQLEKKETVVEESESKDGHRGVDRGN